MNKEYSSQKNVLSHPESWSSENAINFYSTHRNSLDDIYDSEKYFLSHIIQQVDSVLDLGCATGGFFNVFTRLKPTIIYNGVDISSEMIKKASILHPGVQFQVTKGIALPFKDNTFDLVYCSGALHMTLDWREMINEGWRVSKKYFLFDIRMTQNTPTLEDIKISYEKIAFFDEWDGKSIVPYIVVNVEEFIDIIGSIHPTPAVQQIYGYYHPVSKMTVSIENNVCMTMCCLGKIKQKGENNLWELPIKRPKTQK